MTVVVRRSAMKMWLLAIGAIPLLVVSFDVLTKRRITDWLRGIIFAPADTQIYEPRDVIWAWAMLIFSIAVVVWGLKELFVPTKVIECLDRGLALKLRGPFRAADVVPWPDMVSVRSGTIEDDGERLPVLMVTHDITDALATGGRTLTIDSDPVAIRSEEPRSISGIDVPSGNDPAPIPTRRPQPHK